MKKVFVSRNIAEVGLLKSLLEEEGIVGFIKNEHLFMTAGEVPFTEVYPELWVSDDDTARAEQLVSRWHEKPPEYSEPWTCANCGEENEGQFGECWNCGKPIDESGDTQY